MKSIVIVMYRVAMKYYCSRPVGENKVTELFTYRIILHCWNIFSILKRWNGVVKRRQIRERASVVAHNGHRLMRITWRGSPETNNACNIGD